MGAMRSYWISLWLLGATLLLLLVAVEVVPPTYTDSLKIALYVMLVAVLGPTLEKIGMIGYQTYTDWRSNN